MRTSAVGWARRTAFLPAVVVLLAGCGGRDGGDSAGARPGVWRGTELVVTTDNGVRLRPTDGDRVRVEEDVHVDWSHHDGTWVADLSCPDGDHEADGDDGRAGQCPRTPEIDVPAGIPVTVSARNAGIDAAGLTGALDLTTVNGDVTVTRSGDGDATVRLVTRNGSVRADALRAGRLHARTVNGDVVLGCSTSAAAVTGATTNGSVQVTVPDDAPAYRVDATTRNGQASVGVPTDGARGHTMRLTTVNGDVSAARL